MNRRTFVTLAIVVSVIAAISVTSTAKTRTVSSKTGAGGHLLVAEYDNHKILRYDALTGAFVDEFAPKFSSGLKEPQFLVFGPHDSNLYVGSGHFGGPEKGVLRYDGVSGAFIDSFAQGAELDSVHGVIFGPDGQLYVGDTVSTGFGQAHGARILRFDGITGTLLNEFVPLGGGGLRHPFGMIFAPDKQGRHDLYVCDNRGGAGGIACYDGTTGEYRGIVVPSGSGGLGFAVGISLGPDGNFFVASLDIQGGLPAVFRYQGPAGQNPGAFIDVFVPPGSGGLLNPQAAIFGPDGNSDGRPDLYVSNSEYTGQGNDKGHKGTVKRYDGVTGAFIDTFIPIGSGGINNPSGMTFSDTDPMSLAYTGD